MDSEMMRSLEQAGAIEKLAGGLWGVTKAGREMSAVLAGLAREPGDDGINFDYGAWQEADRAFDHAAYDAKRRAVDDEVRGGEGAALDKWMSAHERIMGGERPPWKPNASYNKHGDGLHVYLRDDPSHTQWLCPGIEVMRALSDGRIVGFNVWGLGRVVARGGGELRRPPDEDERYLTMQAMRTPGAESPGDPAAPPEPVA